MGGRITSISVKRKTKQEFDEVKPDDATHDEFVQQLLKAYDPAVYAAEISVDTTDAQAELEELGQFVLVAV